MSVTRTIRTDGINPKINIRPEFTKFGDWAKTRNLLYRVEGVLRIASAKAQKSAAQKLKRIVLRHIRQNGGSIGWPPLSVDYGEYKESLGYDASNILYMTGLYYKSIGVWGVGDRHYVGVKHGVKNRFKGGNNLTVGQIATILENGSTVKNIPPRPLWKPSYRDLGGSRRITNIYVWHIRAEIYKHFGVRVKIRL